jgi:membrane protein DedA with SNARE-associated domain
MAGLLDVPYYVFAPSTAVAALLWAMLYFFAGSFLVTQWQSVVALLTGSADDIVEAAGFVVLVAAFIGLLDLPRTWRAGYRSAG